MKQLITVVGLNLPPLVLTGFLLYQLHAATHSVVSELSSCSTGQLNIPRRLYKMSTLPSGQTGLPCKPQILARGRLAYGLSVSTCPSIYLVYKDLSATGDCGIIGPTHARLTLPYHISDELTWRDVGVADLANLFSNWTSRSPDSQWDESIDDYDKILCYTSLMYPRGLQTVEATWASCSDPDFDGSLRKSLSLQES